VVGHSQAQSDSVTQRSCALLMSLTRLFTSRNRDSLPLVSDPGAMSWRTYSTLALAPISVHRDRWRLRARPDPPRSPDPSRGLTSGVAGNRTVRREVARWSPSLGAFTISPRQERRKDEHYGSRLVPRAEQHHLSTWRPGLLPAPRTMTESPRGGGYPDSKSAAPSLDVAADV
jgi:hypothetical protein